MTKLERDFIIAVLDTYKDLKVNMDKGRLVHEYLQ